MLTQDTPSSKATADTPQRTPPALRPYRANSQRAGDNPTDAPAPLNRPIPIPRKEDPGPGSTVPPFHSLATEGSTLGLTDNDHLAGDDGDFDYEAVVVPLLVLSSCVYACVCRRVVCCVVLVVCVCVRDLFLLLQSSEAPQHKHGQEGSPEDAYIFKVNVFTKQSKYE